jgi:hypothetical protein
MPTLIQMAPFHIRPEEPALSEVERGQRNLAQGTCLAIAQRATAERPGFKNPPTPKSSPPAKGEYPKGEGVNQSRDSDGAGGTANYFDGINWIYRTDN